MQTRVTDQPAYILHRKDWQNTSLLLDLLTRDFGRVNLLAKGAKNSRSRGLFQPFCELTVSWTGRQTLKTLTAIDGRSKEIPESLYMPLLYINELIEAFQPTFESSEEIFIRYGELLDRIDTDNSEACLREFEKAAMKIYGYLPDLDTDCQQGKPISAGSCYQFIANQGLLPCQCDDDNAIEGGVILDWNREKYTTPAVSRVAKIIMRCIIDFNLQGKPLKSRDIYLQMKHWG